MIDPAHTPWAAAKFVAQNLNRNKFLSALTSHGGIVEAINERKPSINYETPNRRRTSVGSLVVMLAASHDHCGIAAWPPIHIRRHNYFFLALPRYSSMFCSGIVLSQASFETRRICPC
jgi:hypothetical protein